MPENVAPSPDVAPQVEQSLDFLRNWPTDFVHLTAVHVDPETGEKGRIEARAFTPADIDNGEVERWLTERAGRANLYFTVNSLIRPEDRKAAKSNVRAMVALHVDVDLPEGVDQTEGTRALLDRVPSLSREPSLVIASGGGLQLFWVLEPSSRIEIDGDEARWTAAEEYNKAMEREAAAVFGSLAKIDHCFNSDRIMRLPGTVNVPDAKKRERGRVAALARIASAAGHVYPLSDFKGGAAGTAGSTASALPAAPVRDRVEVSIAWDEARAIFSDGKLTLEGLGARGVDEETLISLEHGDNLRALCDAHNARGHRVAAGPYSSFNEVTLAVARGLCKAGLSNEEIAAVLGNPAHPGNRHITRQKDEKSRQRAISRAIGKVRADAGGSLKRQAATAAGVPEWRDSWDEYGMEPKATMRNAVIAIAALGVRCRLNLFKGRVEISVDAETRELQSVIGEYTDHAIGVLRSTIDKRWTIDLGDKNVHDAVLEIARENAYDPICDYLTECEGRWDGTPRVDRWVVDYLGVEDTPLNRAVGRSVLLASVRRARQPGCKYDNITVLEGAEGLGKSSLVEILYGTEYFSDQHILGLDDKQVMENLEGVWGYECADLTGMGRAEVEKIKAFASRTHDRARKAWGKVREDVPRRCVLWGSTNEEIYLLSQTGNRRWQSLEIPSRIDLDRVRRDRDQIWGEAARLEREAVSVNIPEELWGEARAAQEARRISDPWEDIAASLPRFITVRDADGRQQVRIIHFSKESLGLEHWNPAPTERAESRVLLEHAFGVAPAQQTQFHYKRLSTVMEKAGWRRTKSGVLRIGGKNTRGYWRPAADDETAYAPPPPPQQRGEDQQDDIPF